MYHSNSTKKHLLQVLFPNKFPWLKNICQRITKNPNCFARILDYIKVCIVLHNLLIQQYDDEDDKDFQFEDDEVSLIDADNELNQPVDYQDIEDYGRNHHEQLAAYFLLGH